jgi:hypothetical protein
MGLDIVSSQYSEELCSIKSLPVLNNEYQTISFRGNTGKCRSFEPLATILSPDQYITLYMFQFKDTLFNGIVWIINVPLRALGLKMWSSAWHYWEMVERLRGGPSGRLQVIGDMPLKGTVGPWSPPLCFFCFLAMR